MLGLAYLISIRKYRISSGILITPPLDWQDIPSRTCSFSFLASRYNCRSLLTTYNCQLVRFLYLASYRRVSPNFIGQQQISAFHSRRALLLLVSSPLDDLIVITHLNIYLYVGHIRGILVATADCASSSSGMFDSPEWMERNPTRRILRYYY